MSRAESAARHVLAEAGVTGPPIDVQDLAEAHGATLHFEPFEGDISGMVVRRPDGIVHFAINERHTETRKRFTIAHELGHLLLHEGKPVIVEKAVRVNLRGPTASLGTDREEREANAFAAELLMPAAVVEQEVRGFVAGQTTISDGELIGFLAELFDVSTQAMQYRLVNLRLLAPYGMAS